jgi:hypothetical protein
MSKVCKTEVAMHILVVIIYTAIVVLFIKGGV